MRSRTLYLFPIPLLSTLSSAATRPKTKPEPTPARLQRLLNGAWQDTDGKGITLELRRNATDGGMVYYWGTESYKGQKAVRLYEQSPYRVIGKDTIKEMNTKAVYRVKFTPKGMEWSLLQVPGEVRHFRRLHQIAPRSSPTPS